MSFFLKDLLVFFFLPEIQTAPDIRTKIHYQERGLIAKIKDSSPRRPKCKETKDSNLDNERLTSLANVEILQEIMDDMILTLFKHSEAANTLL